MEQKSIKTGICNYETVFNDTAEQPIDIDFTLPDYYPDISKILKCRAVPRISTKGINGTTAFVEGSVTVTVMYCGSDNCVSSYEYQYPFSKSFDTGISTDGARISAKAKCEYINCRAVTSRKIDIHGAVGIYITLNKNKITDIVSDIDDSCIELLRDNVPATIPMGCTDKYLTLEEEIELGSGQPDVRCLIRYDAAVSVNDTKILAGKSVVSGEMSLKILYAPESGSSLQTVRYKLPFSQLIEVEGLGDGCDCESKVSIAQLEIKPRISAGGSCRQFSLFTKLLITSECCCNNDVSVIKDAYSRKYEADINKNEVCFNKICENINQSFNCKKNFEFPKGSIVSVCDMWCEVKTDTVSFNENGMTVNGIVTAFIIANDCDGIPTFYEKQIDFEYTHPLENAKHCSCAPEITVQSSNYTILDDCNIELRVELKLCAAVFCKTQIPLIVDIKVNNEKTCDKSGHGAMTIYFASSGESVWDISKKYFADINEVKAINEIDEDIFTSDRMILVPTE